MRMGAGTTRETGIPAGAITAPGAGSVLAGLVRRRGHADIHGDEDGRAQRANNILNSNFVQHPGFTCDAPWRGRRGIGYPAGSARGRIRPVRLDMRQWVPRQDAVAENELRESEAARELQARRFPGQGGGGGEVVEGGAAWRARAGLAVASGRGAARSRAGAASGMWRFPLTGS